MKLTNYLRLESKLKLSGAAPRIRFIFMEFTRTTVPLYTLVCMCIRVRWEADRVCREGTGYVVCDLFRCKFPGLTLRNKN